jgi:hypothetical protein
MRGDEVVLTLPRERPFLGVAHLVVGGLAVRLNLSYDQLEDLQVAFTELLGHREGAREISLAVRMGEGHLEATVGPFDDALVAELERAAGADVGLRRVLETVVDHIEVTERDGEPWVALRKAIEPSTVTS